MPIRIKTFFIFLFGSLFSIVTITASLSFSLRDQLSREVLTSPILLTVFANIVFVVLASLFFASTITSPITELHRIVREIKSGRLSARSRTAANRNDELGELALAVNSMATELQDQKVRLERELARNQAFLQSIGDGLIIINAGQNIEFMNDAAAQMLRFEKQNILGKPYHSVISLEDEAGKKISFEERPVAEAFAGKTISTRPDDPVYYYVRSDKTRFPAAFTKTPVEMEGEIIGVIDIFRDITIGKELERSKSEFVSLASHQLRTPLSVVSMNAELLKTYGSNMEEKEYQQTVDGIYQGAKRMAALINSLLNVSRIEAKSIAVGAISRVNIRKIIDDTLQELRPGAENKHINLAVNSEDGTAIETDVNLLHIVLQNLISNAIRYTPENGTVTISAKPVAKELLIEVSDTGYGIPRRQQEKVFEKFFRADNTKQLEADGTGLGLYIVKSYVDNLGGTISFVSEENKGTTFSLRLPLVHPKRERERERDD